MLSMWDIGFSWDIWVLGFVENGGLIFVVVVKNEV